MIPAFSGPASAVDILRGLASAPAACVAAGAGVLLLLIWAGIRTVRRRTGRRNEQITLEKTTSLFIGERQRANLVLQDLDVGVLLYNSSGQLVSRNPAALTLLGALSIYRHRTNIQRLIAGTENKFQRKKKS